MIRRPLIFVLALIALCCGFSLGFSRPAHTAGNDQKSYAGDACHPIMPRVAATPDPDVDIAVYAPYLVGQLPDGLPVGSGTPGTVISGGISAQLDTVVDHYAGVLSLACPMMRDNVAGSSPFVSVFINLYDANPTGDVVCWVEQNAANPLNPATPSVYSTMTSSGVAFSGGYKSISIFTPSTAYASGNSSLHCDLKQGTAVLSYRYIESGTGDGQ